MAFPQGINFRNTIGYVTDGANDSAQLAPAVDYPRTTAQGNTVGWEVGQIAYYAAANQNAALDPRLAGSQPQDVDDLTTYRIDLSSAGQYDITLAMGDYGDRADQKCEVFDNITSLSVLFDASTSAADRYFDASGVERTSAAWPGSNVPKRLTFTSTIARFKIGQKTGGRTTYFTGVNHISLAATGPTIDTQPTNQTGAAGSTATFTVAATTSGGTLHYQWKEIPAIGGAASNVGTDSDSYTTGTLVRSTDAGKQVYCTVSDDNGSLDTSTVMLFVTAIPASYSGIGVIVGAGDSFIGEAMTGGPVGAGPVTHATTGALAAQSATAAGTAPHIKIHATSGALTAPSATAAGAAPHVKKHATTGALTAQSAADAGTSKRTRVHAATGALTATAATAAGTAPHIKKHASTGALTALAAAASTFNGTVARADPVLAVTHATSGDLQGAAARAAGSCALLVEHVTSGRLAGLPAAVDGLAYFPFQRGRNRMGDEARLLSRRAELSSARMQASANLDTLAGDEARLLSRSADLLAMRMQASAKLAALRASPRAHG